MNKYNEAFVNIKRLVDCNELHFDDLKILLEAIHKAEAYDVIRSHAVISLHGASKEEIDLLNEVWNNE